MERKTILQEHVIQGMEGCKDRGWDVETMSDYLITKTHDGKQVKHRNISEIIFPCDGRKVSISIESLQNNFRTARTEGLRKEMSQP